MNRFRLKSFRHPQLSGRLLPAVLLVWLLSGCDAGTPAGSVKDGQIELGIPEKIRRVSAVNLDAVIATANVTVNNDTSGQDYPMARNGDKFQTTITLENVTSVSVNLRFSERLDSGDIIDLARHPQVTRSIVNGNNVMQFFEEDFRDNFDADNDGITNLQERNLGTDPLTPNSVDTTRDLTISFNLPAVLPDPLVTQAIVTFSGIPRAVNRSGNRLTINGEVTTVANVDVEVVLLQRVNNRQVVLATAVLTVLAGFDAVTQELSDNNFDFSRDDDGDGQTNLVEVRNGTDPFSAD